MRILIVTLIVALCLVTVVISDSDNHGKNVHKQQSDVSDSKHLINDHDDKVFKKEKDKSIISKDAQDARHTIVNTNDEKVLKQGNTRVSSSKKDNRKQHGHSHGKGKQNGVSKSSDMTPSVKTRKQSKSKSHKDNERSHKQNRKHGRGKSTQ